MWHISRHLSWVKSTKNVSRITAHFLLTVTEYIGLEFQKSSTFKIRIRYGYLHIKFLDKSSQKITAENRGGTDLHFFDPVRFPFDFNSFEWNLNRIWTKIEQKLRGGQWKLSSGYLAFIYDYIHTSCKIANLSLPIRNFQFPFKFCSISIPFLLNFC